MHYISFSIPYLDIAQEVLQKLSSSNRPLDKTTKTMLKVEFLSPVDTVLIERIDDDCCSEEFLEMYFRNKKTSGAGVKVGVVVTGKGQAAVTFDDLSGECEECKLHECTIPFT